MLVEFSVTNLLSFRERVTLSLVAAPTGDGPDELSENTFEVPGPIRLLKTSLVFGANASGKSNLIKAVTFARKFILDSAKETQSGEGIAVKPFRPAAPTAKSSGFEFIWVMGDALYRYSFSLDSTSVVDEALYRKQKDAQNEIQLFRREPASFVVGEEFDEGRDVVSKTRANALFLSVVAQFNGQESQKILEWFRLTLRSASGLDDNSLLPYTVQQLSTDRGTQILDLIREADLGITGVVPPEQAEANTNVAIVGSESELPEEVSSRIRRQLAARAIKVRHGTYDSLGKQVGEVEFGLNDESQGTNKFIALAGPLIDVLRRPCVLFLDELDARLHPRLTRAIISLFLSRSNARNAQLVAVTHDTNLLDHRLLRSDQIWFTDKAGSGATRLYSLVEFDLPEKASYERDYLLGKFGAVPSVGELVRPEPPK